MDRLWAGLVSGFWVLVLFVALFGVVLNVPSAGGSGTIYVSAKEGVDPSGTSELKSSDRTSSVYYSLKAPQEPPATQWIKTYGGSGEDQAYSVQQTNDGGYIIAGFTSSFGTGGFDFWVVKTDAVGNMEWNRTYGMFTGTEDRAYSVVQTSDGGYAVAGSTQLRWDRPDDVLLVKIDAFGNQQWTKTYGGASYDGAYSVIQTSDEGYMLAGYTASFGAGLNDAWLIKTDAFGNMQWNKTYGVSGYDEARCVVQTSDGGYIMAGSLDYEFWLTKMDSDGEKQWNRTYGRTYGGGAYSVQQTSDGAYIAAGSWLPPGAQSDFRLLKIYENGTIQWDKTFGGGNQDWAYSVAQTHDEGYIVAGFADSFDQQLWLIRTDENGDMRWNKTYEGEGWSIMQTTDRGYVVAGFVYVSWGNTDFRLIKLAPEPIRVPFDYPTIQEALNAANPGDTVLVRSGVYVENVLVNKSLSLIGENPATTIIDGGGIGNVVSIIANNVEIQNFNVKNSGGGWISGINIENCNGTLIKNNEIANNRFGIYLKNSSRNIIYGNNLTNNNDCIFLDKGCSNNTVSGNNITNNEHAVDVRDYSNNNVISENNITNNRWNGIYLFNSSKNVISGNNITNNGDGVSLYGFSSNNSISENYMINNTLGISLYDSSNNSITGNHITDNEWGINVGGSSNVISGNLMNRNKYNLDVSGDVWSHLIDASNLVDGKPVHYLVNQKDLVINPPIYPQVGYLALINSINITVEGLTLTKNGQGVLLYNTNNSRIVNNNIINNYWGISQAHLSNNAIQGNNITNNWVGIWIYYSSYNSIVGNNITNNDGDGIRINNDANNNTVSGNHITNNAGGGIDIREGSSGTTVSRNNITNNGGWGVHLDMYLDGKFYHNNFINNTIQVHGYIHTSTVWNNGYPSGGNYWSDYTGADANGDGIGDAPYVVYILMYENVTDRYPLMAPFSMFEAGTWNNVTYYVDIITNSTVSDFNFDQDKKMINLNVTGPGGTDGFSRVSIPKKLLWCESLEEWRVHIIGIELPIGWKPTILEDDNYTYIYIPYWHPASYSVPIQIEGTYAIPEFPPAILLPLLMILSIIAVVFAKKKRKTKAIFQSPISM